MLKKERAESVMPPARAISCCLRAEVIWSPYLYSPIATWLIVDIAAELVSLPMSFWDL